MILCIDIGNTHIFCGVFSDEKLILRFRYPTLMHCSSDQLGVFLKSTLKENNLSPDRINNIIISSVVPSVDYSMKAACIKYFDINPIELKPGIKTGLKIKVRNPIEVGADRIANAVAASNYFPNKNIIIVDLGTATTLCCITNNKDFLGGIIIPGYKISMEALHKNTEKLAPVSIVKPKFALGKTSEESIQSGLYYCQLGAIKESISNLMKDVFSSEEEVVILGTGGYAYLFEEENLFTNILSDLTLYGLLIIFNKNS